MRRWSALLMIWLAGCTGQGPAARPDASGSPAPSASPTSSTAPVLPGATPGSRTIVVYTLARGGDRTYVAPERRTIPRTRAIARAALESMVRGPLSDPDHSSPWPRDARILGLTVRGGTAIVDWSAEVLEASAGATTETLGIQQAIYTLLRLNAGVQRLELRVEGKTRGAASNGRRIEDWWGHVGLDDQPFSPMDNVEAPISLWTPREGATARGRLVAEGEASTFEANVGIRLRNAAGRVVRSTSTTASAGAPDRGDWRAVVSLRGLPPGRYVFEAYEASAKDGSITFSETRRIRIRA